MYYFLYITGCDMNHSDAERIASIFNECGFSITSDEKKADILVAVACSVREKAVHKIYGKVNEWAKTQSAKRKANKYIIVTGCVLPEDKRKLAEKADLVFEITRIEELENFLMSNYKSQMLNQCQFSKSKDGYLFIKPSYQNKFSAFIPIMTGCDNFCTYCAVPYTRGREVSRSEKEILEEVRGLIEKGYKEITLLGQNVNSYGAKDAKRKTKNPFIQLLEKIDALSGDFWVRFYSNHPKDMSDELIDFLVKSKHFCHYIHLPLQSGDDEILRKMNRHYTAKQYLELVKKIRKKIPDVTLTTDVIAGFPGESEKAFQNTVDVMEKSGFDMAFIAEYSPRFGTVAAKMKDDVPKAEKTRRKKYLNDEVLAKSVLKNNKKLIGKIVRILVLHKDKKGFFVGKTEGAKDVRFDLASEVESHGTVIGSFVNIKILRVGSWGMEGVWIK